MEDYPHSSVPEVLLAAAAARTRRVHLGHAAVQSPPVNHAAALRRKQWMPALPADDIPAIKAFGKTVVAAKEVTDKPGYRIGAAGGHEVPMQDLAARKLDTAAV